MGSWQSAGKCEEIFRKNTEKWEPLKNNIISSMQFTTKIKL